MKRFTATAGNRNNQVTVSVEIPNASGEMTPEQARQAARIAFGHTSGVTVDDGSKAYRLTASGARKVNMQD